MENKHLANDESRREQQLESMKARVDSDINASIARRAGETRTAEAARMEQVAREMRGDAIEGVVEKDRELGRARGLARAAQVVNYLFGILYVALVVRLVLTAAAARQGAGFVRFVDALTNPFYRPFKGIVASPSMQGGYTLALPILIALGAYAILHVGILGLLRLVAHRQTEI